MTGNKKTHRKWGRYPMSFGEDGGGVGEGGGWGEENGMWYKERHTKEKYHNQREVVRVVVREKNRVLETYDDVPPP